MFLPVLCVVVIILFILGTLIYYVCMMKKHKKAYEHEKTTYSKSDLPVDIKNGGFLLFERKISYVRNYIIFQLAHKIFGLASVVFSLLGLIAISATITNYLGMNVWLEYVIAFLSIVFVVIALYLSPTNRVEQYITAWKQVDAKTSELISSIDADTYLGKKMKEAEEKNDTDTAEKLRNEISKKAIGIAEVISNAEQILTSDGE